MLDALLLDGVEKMGARVPRADDVVRVPLTRVRMSSRSIPSGDIRSIEGG